MDTMGRKTHTPQGAKRKPGAQPGNTNRGGPGAKEERTKQRAEKINYAVALLEKDYREKHDGEDPGMPFDGDAVAFMQMIYKCPAFPLAIRYDAAKNAAPYERPRLQAVLMNVDPKTGETITPPAPPSLLVEFETGDAVNVSDLQSDPNVTDVVDENEAAPVSKSAA